MLYHLLRRQNALVYPVLLLGLMHLVYLILTGSGSVDTSAMIWAWIALMTLGSGILSHIILMRLTGSGGLEPILSREAYAYINVAKKRMMVGDAETLIYATMLRVPGGRALLALTDSRMIIVRFCRLLDRVEVVTECDPAAVKSVLTRTRHRHFSDWMRGVVYHSGLEIQLVGLKAPQQLWFLEPVSLTRIKTILQQTTAQRPARHGARLIQYFPRRRVLKKRYIEGLFPREVETFLPAFLMSTIFPGFGQMKQGRYRAGCLFSGFFIVTLLAMLSRGASLGLEAIDRDYASMMIVMILVWSMSIFELFIHRHIHAGLEP